MKKIVIFIFLVVIFITGCSNTNTGVDNVISVENVREIIDNYEKEENVYIIDVREKEEYQEGHLQYAINVPLSNLNSITDIDTLNKDSKIIVYCRSGSRSKQAQSKLMEMGYTEVYDMGGILDWPYIIYQEFEVE